MPKKAKGKVDQKALPKHGKKVRKQRTKSQFRTLKSGKQALEGTHDGIDHEECNITIETVQGLGIQGQNQKKQCKKKLRNTAPSVSRLEKEHPGSIIKAILKALQHLPGPHCRHIRTILQGETMLNKTKLVFLYFITSKYPLYAPLGTVLSDAMLKMLTRLENRRQNKEDHQRLDQARKSLASLKSIRDQVASFYASSPPISITQFQDSIMNSMFKCRASPENFAFTQHGLASIRQGKLKEQNALRTHLSEIERRMEMDGWEGERWLEFICPNLGGTQLEEPSYEDSPSFIKIYLEGEEFEDFP